MLAVMLGLLGAIIQAGTRTAKQIPKPFLRRWCANLPLGFIGYLGYAFIVWAGIAYKIEGYIAFLAFLLAFWIISVILQVIFIRLFLTALRHPSWETSHRATYEEASQTK